VVDESPIWSDPFRAAMDVIQADPRVTCEMLLAAMHQPGAGAPGAADPEWTRRWQRLGARVRQAVQDRLAAIDEPFEGKVFARLGDLLPDGATLYVGNSMPVRDLDTFFPATAARIRVLGNRGASGIDGTISSALGVAAGGDGPVVLVLGDLAFYHDMNGLLAAKLYRLNATIVLLNNDGGGIFSFLPQAGCPDHFEMLFGTPTGLEFRHAADMYGASFVRADEWAAFDDAVRRGGAAPGLKIVEMRTDRTRNVDLHRQVWAAVEEEVTRSCP
jgi:2-succinyl-5-enolpyruvyl-6-hydroxy-3-cyclohexene-1-carboxylate synthase